MEDIQVSDRAFDDIENGRFHGEKIIRVLADHLASVE